MKAREGYSVPAALNGIPAVVVFVSIAAWMFAGDFRASHAAPPPGTETGDPMLREGSFAYSAKEGEKCAKPLGMVREARDPAVRKSYLDIFVSCVRRHRSNLEADARRAQEANAQRARDETVAKDRAAEAAKLAEREAEKQREVQAVADDPKSAQAILSALLCNQLDDRSATLAAIAKDRKYSQIGGAVNLHRRAELQDELAAVDDGIASVRSSLRGMKRHALRCKVPTVALLASCLSADRDDRGDECQTPEAKIMIRAATVLVAD